MHRAFFNYNLANGLFFYITWYACVYAAVLNFEMLGLVIGFLLITLHFCFSKVKRADGVFLIAYLVIATIGDWTLLSLGAITYPPVSYALPFFGTDIPLWILMVYASFSTTINHSFLIMHRYPLPIALSTGIGGAVSYYLTQRIGAIFLPLGWLSLTAIALYWFLLVWISKGLHSLLSPWLKTKSI